jgi:hypothetical protein
MYYPRKADEDGTRPMLSMAEPLTQQHLIPADRGKGGGGGGGGQIFQRLSRRPLNRNQVT